MQQEVRRRLEDDAGSLMQTLSDEFESTVYRTALEFTHGRKIEAALKLGVGRNTLTRKIQELGIWSR